MSLESKGKLFSHTKERANRCAKRVKFSDKIRTYADVVKIEPQDKKDDKRDYENQ